ncbi:MAG: hypothetical protein ACEQSR_01280 [Candidatus Methylacidiphilales bacterium]
MPSYIELLPMDAADVPNATDGRYNYFIDAADEQPKLKNSTGVIASAGGGSAQLEIGIAPLYSFNKDIATPILTPQAWFPQIEIAQNPSLILALINKLGNEKIKHFYFGPDLSWNTSNLALDEIGYNNIGINTEPFWTAYGISVSKTKEIQRNEEDSTIVNEYIFRVFIDKKTDFANQSAIHRTGNYFTKVWIATDGNNPGIFDVLNNNVVDINGVSKSISYFTTFQTIYEI